MPHPKRTPLGTTLIELLIALAIVGILAAAAVPRFGRLVREFRVNGALDRVVTEIYRARTTAVENGRPVRLVLSSDANQCLDHLRMIVETPTGPPESFVAPLEVPSTCLRHSGDSVLVFSGRGMLRPPARSIFSVGEGSADSVLLSIAGRVRRSE